MNNINFNGDFLNVPSTLQILDISKNKFDGSFPTFNSSNCSLSFKYFELLQIFIVARPKMFVYCNELVLN